MSFLISIILAIVFSTLSSFITAGILMGLYYKKIDECLVAATKKVKRTIGEKESK